MQILLDLAASSEVIARLPETDVWLGRGERERLETMRHPQRRAQFLAGHGLARELLARVEGGNWRDWQLERDAHGAPQTLYRGRASNLHLSLAHSGTRIACAVSDQPLGLDLESAPRQRDLLTLAETLYPDEFFRFLAQLDEDERRRHFYRRWTLDEAHGKALGTGLQAKTLAHQHWRSANERPAQAWTYDLDNGFLALAIPQSMQAWPQIAGQENLLTTPPQAWIREQA